MSSLLPRPSRSGSTPGTFSADAYFSMQSAPENLEVVVKGVEDFIACQMRVGRRVVLVTVGRRSFPDRSFTILGARARIGSSLFPLHTRIYH